MPVYDAILWDFGDTLADQTWMLECPEGIGQWSEVFMEQIWHGELGLYWNCGTVSVDEVAVALSEIVEVDVSLLLNHFRKCCRQIRFFWEPMAVVESMRCRQAIVTVNPDIFTKWIVPTYRLDDLFDLTMASWQIGSVDKSALCNAAISELGRGVERERVLLIDNVEDNVRSWREKGGLGYHFTDSRAFVKDAPGLFGAAGAV